MSAPDKSQPTPPPRREEDDEMFDPADGEEVEIDDSAPPPEDEDMGMDEEIELENDSAAYFDQHSDSVFAIAQHPVHSQIFASGGGDDVAYVFEAVIPEPRVLPASFEADPSNSAKPREGLKALFKAEGHTDSVNAIAFTEPKGEYLVTAGLDGRLLIFKDVSPDLSGKKWKKVQVSQEVEEINYLAVNKNSSEHPNTIAFGANDGSVWVYDLEGVDEKTGPTIVQAYYLHKGSSTAGSWTPNGQFLCTCAEDSSFYVWDIYGHAAILQAAAGQSSSGEGAGQAIVSFTEEDKRFAVDGGLFSLAINPAGNLCAVGGAEGHLRVISLPRLDSPAAPTGSTAKPAKAAAERAGRAAKGAAAASSATQAGQILISSQAQADSIETLAFSPTSFNLLASGSSDGSIVIYDAGHNFAVRRHIEAAHEGAVVKVEFADTNVSRGWLLTSCGVDGVLRRWENRATNAEEWKGHLGISAPENEGDEEEAEKGGIMGFASAHGGAITATAGDE
jgi:ribosome assembly protein SQT1